MREVTVHSRWVEDASYRVVIGHGLLGGILVGLRSDYPGRPLFLVTDANLLSAGHVDTVRGDERIGSFIIDPPGEESKTLATVTRIVETMERLALGRDTILIALGGGTVGDTGGFAAAIYKRGIACVQVPTTTVAQADSSIGGKTGVDSLLSKNAFGAFVHPLRIYMDVGTLKSVPDRDYRAGLVESVKHAVIADPAYFEFIESRLGLILERSPETMEALAERNAIIKGRVVEQDPYEQNLRRVLNFGHTLGHAVESVSRYRLLHGEAVALGMRGAMILAEIMGLASPPPRARVEKILADLGMPDRIPQGLSMDALLDAVSRDKKSANRRPRVVLVEEIGRVHRDGDRVAVPVDEAHLRKAIAALS